MAARLSTSAAHVGLPGFARLPQRSAFGRCGLASLGELFPTNRTTEGQCGV